MQISNAGNHALSRIRLLSRGSEPPWLVTQCSRGTRLDPQRGDESFTLPHSVPVSRCLLFSLDERGDMGEKKSDGGVMEEGFRVGSVQR